MNNNIGHQPRGGSLDQNRESGSASGGAQPTLGPSVVTNADSVLLTSPYHPSYGRIITQAARDRLAVYDDGRVFLVAGAENYPDVIAALSLLRRLGAYRLQDPRFVDPGTIKSFYHQNRLASPADAKIDKKAAAPAIGSADSLQDDAYKILQTAVDLEGVSDVIVRVDRKKARVFALVDGVMERLLEWDPEYGVRFQRSVYSWAGIDGTAERGWREDGHQIGQITNGLPEGLDSIRIQTLSTHMGGKELIMRLMPHYDGQVTLEGLKFTPEEIADFDSLVGISAGIVIVTGPTGCGKTHTLHGMLSLSLVTFPGDRWLTVEDPVEIGLDLDNVTQIDATINGGDDIDKIYNQHLSAAMRSIPKRLMFGEIRSPESAAITTRAARTGHGVLTSLHTDDAFGAVPRLIEMGVDRSLVMADIRGLTSQRLLRRLCECAVEIDRKDWKGYCPPWLEAIFAKGGRVRLPNPEPCDKCRKGYVKGRTVLPEVVRTDQKMLELLIDGKLEEARRRWRAEGGITMADRALAGVTQGTFCPREVMRCMNM